MTQFAMVEELAALIKDNLHCKHLILSTEEALNNFLQNDSSPEAILELQPMSPYQRLLLHRLAEIYGFAHESVGEGEERHVLLERCPETTIPPVLVSDILWQYGEYQSAAPAHILRRKPSQEDKAAPSSTPLEVREAAYLAARERIFSLHEGNEREPAPLKPREVPVVAQRMIAHALGQRVSSLHICERKDKDNDSQHASVEANGANEVSDVCESGPRLRRDLKLPANAGGYRSSSAPERRTSVGVTARRKEANPEKLEKEQIGAARRIFAQALGIGSSNRNQNVS